MSIVYNIHLPKEKIIKNFSEDKLSLTINKIKARNFAVIRPEIRLYNLDEEQVGVVKTPTPYIVTPTYTNITHTFDINNNLDIVYYDVVIRADGITDDNPLFFSELMVNEGEQVSYVKPENDIGESSVEFVNNFYALYYSSDLKGSLQIIRPNYDKITTKNLLRSKCTVLAPHLNDELDPDKHENIGLEYMNMTEQSIILVR